MDLIEHEALFLVNRIEAFLSGTSGTLGSMNIATRSKLSEAARRLNLATETSGDTIQRIMLSPLQLPLTVVGIETRLFEVLSKANGRMIDKQELSIVTKINPVLLKRLLRYYQAFGMLDQLGDDHYQANNMTSAISSPGGRNALPFYFEAVVPALNAIPRCLRDNAYQNVTYGECFPWYVGHQTNKEIYEWMKDHPSALHHFMSYMVRQRDGQHTFLDVVDFREFTKSVVSKNTPVFVDIGGSLGHQCVALRQKYPDLVGRVILQDSEEVIEQARIHPIPGFEGIEAQVHDFFTPQPIKGARTYYMRNILHNWPDDKCIEILKNIKSAMTQESRILIDEMVFPESDVHWRAAQLDLVMGSCFGSMGRTQQDWDTLFEKSELEVLKVWKYTANLDDCVIVAVPK
ncbi:S-adenosyl-L-methionine-dependent methyltransferase [Xylaria bambusicola]|uniref:S-adenosyl-L-methionine-dependent methyltransferase n=1 Tax=Xylaria bambusicola TaxID=326684 RepID=UPI002007B91B|nr:S-adenosyl-L-methionine-dependent methyltransferase [Xylaria bambusicola]KAI0518114.1 S-adenosyl-L-methionine-dependent methyltransferase [Xylaria bambusicola]